MNHVLKRSSILFAEAATAALLLPACGGGGDGSAADTAAAPADNATATADSGVSPGDATQVAATPDSAAPEQDYDADRTENSLRSGWQTVVDNTGPKEPDTAPVETADATTAAAAEAAAREEAQATTYATPKVAALDYSQNFSSDRKALLAKHKLVIIGIGRDKSSSTINSMINGIKSLNPSTKVGQYVMINELPCYTSSTSSYNALTTEANRANWWLRKSDGTRAQWTTAYGACDINVTAWNRKNSAGQTWMQYKWQQDYNEFFRYSPYDYVFIDNFWYKPRVNADYKRIGTNQSPDESTIQAATRAGLANYVSLVRNTKSSLKVMGNANSDLHYTEFAEKLDGAFIEGLIGKSWSRETWAGWKSALDYYRGQIRNTRSPNDVIAQTFADPYDYRTVRYGLATAMMDNGWFMYIPKTGTMVPKWFDEFGARIGTPVDAPPTAAKQNGIWMRKYTNGLVLVNPSKTSSASIYVGSGYRRLKGTQDPTVNNGAWQSTVTLGPRQGLLMVRS